MKKMRGKLVLMAAVWGTVVLGEPSPSQIRGAVGTLTVDAKGVSLAPAVAGCPSSVATGEAWWSVMLWSPRREESAIMWCWTARDRPYRVSSRRGTA